MEKRGLFYFTNLSTGQLHEHFECCMMVYGKAKGLKEKPTCHSGIISAITALRKGFDDCNPELQELRLGITALRKGYHMKILVDADACPVKEIIVRIAKLNQIPVMMFIDTSHVLNDGYSTVVTVDKARDSVDITLANKMQDGDIVVTQDYGVAAMALGKRALAVNQNGLVYTAANIDRLLFERHLGQKIRRSGGKTANFKKRTKQDDKAFEEAFMKLIGEA